MTLPPVHTLSLPWLATLLGVITLGAATGCERREPGDCPRFGLTFRPPPARQDPVVAEVNGRPVTASQVARRAHELGLNARAALEDVVDEELLVQEAERLGLHRDPEVVVAAKQAAVYSLLREGFERDFTARVVPEQDLRKLYRLNERVHFRRPEVRRFSHIFAPRPWHRKGRRWVLDGVEDRRLRAVFAALRADVLSAGPKTWKNFEALATPARGRGFSLSVERGSKARDELQQPFADALFSLGLPGAVSEVIVTRAHIHVAFLVEIVPSTNVTYEEARDTILSRHFPEARRKAFRELLNGARARCKIRVRPEHLPVTE